MIKSYAQCIIWILVAVDGKLTGTVQNFLSVEHYRRQLYFVIKGLSDEL